MIIAHRGRPHKAPENTIQSFDNAVADGAKWIETDVSKSKDGQLFLQHDQFVIEQKRMHLLENLDYQQFLQLATAQPASLNQFLLWFGMQKNLQCFLELKSSVAYGSLQTLINMIKPYQNKLIISSFNHKLIANIRQYMPDARLMLLYVAASLNMQKDIKDVKAEYVGFALTALEPRLPEKVTEANAKALVYTVNCKITAQQLLEQGYTGYFTDTLPLTDNS